MAPFFYLPHTLFVAERGLDHFELSMRAQYELTKRFSAEAQHSPVHRRGSRARVGAASSVGGGRERARASARLRGHAASASVGDARRLARSNPERVLELLELLKDDPSTLVRRSVANNLNDLGKVQPGLADPHGCAPGSRTRRPSGARLVEHALRSAVKRGDAGRARRCSATAEAASCPLERRGVQSAPRADRRARGDELRADEHVDARTQDLLVDVAVHFVKARGVGAPKVFKLERIALGPRERVELATTFSLAVHTTRMPRPGRHAVDVVVNGRAMRAGSFNVSPT